MKNPLFFSAFLGALLASLPLASGAVKIACIGDSITEGAGLGSPSIESYPAKLQRLLGSDYQVLNYGVSGRTLLKQGDFPYWNEAAYRQSRDSNPDIVIIQLGTNDSKPQNWRWGTNFVAAYQSLISSYTNLPSHPRLLLCTEHVVDYRGTSGIQRRGIRSRDKHGLIAGTHLSPLATLSQLPLTASNNHRESPLNSEWARPTPCTFPPYPL